MKEYEFLIRRAFRFESDAKSDYEKGFYDLALFHIEQAAQLLIKAKLFELLGEYPKTHDLIFLLEELKKVWKEKENEIEEFIKKNKVNLSRLIDIYITARYHARDFYAEEVEEMLKLLENLKRILGYESSKFSY